VAIADVAGLDPHRWNYVSVMHQLHKLMMCVRTGGSMGMLEFSVQQVREVEPSPAWQVAGEGEEREVGMTQRCSMLVSVPTSALATVLHFNQYLHIPVALHILKQSVIFLQQVNDSIIECMILKFDIDSTSPVGGRDTVLSLWSEGR